MAAKRKTKSNIKTRFTNTKGEKVTVYTDGSKTRTGGSSSPKESVSDTVNRANAMLTQTQAEGSKPFAGSSYEKDLKVGKKFEPVVLSTESGKSKFQSQIMPTIMKANEGLSQLGIKDTTTDTKGTEEDPLIQAEYEASLTPEQKASNDYLGSLTKQSDALTKAYDEMAKASARTARAQTNTLRRQYEERKGMLENENKANRSEWQQQFIRSGQSEYSPGMTSDFLSAKEREGQARIQELNDVYMAKVDEVNAALEEKQYSIAATKAQEIQKIEEQVREHIAEQSKLAREENQAMRERIAKVSQQGAVIGLIQQGITDPGQIFEYLNYDADGNFTGDVSFDDVKAITDSLIGEAGEQFTLGRYDVRYDAQGNVIARGMGEAAPSGGSTANVGSITPIGTPTVEGIGNSYKNSSFEAQMLMDDIMNKIPVQLRNTEKEVEMKYEQIRKQLAAGYSYQQIVDRLSGFSLQGQADRQLGGVFYDLALAAGDKLEAGTLASMLNRGANEQAMTSVENALLSDASGFFAKTDKARATLGQAKVVLDILNDPTFPKDALGAFDGRKFKVERFLALNDTQRAKVQKLETALQLLASPIRVEVAGTAATPSEMEKISAFQADILSQPDVIKTQVESLRDAVAGFHNEARTQRGLPEVTTDEINSNQKRLAKYREVGVSNATQQYQGMSNSDFLKAFGGQTEEPDVSLDFWDSILQLENVSSQI